VPAGVAPEAPPELLPLELLEALPLLLLTLPLLLLELPLELVLELLLLELLPELLVELPLPLELLVLLLLADGELDPPHPSSVKAPTSAITSDRANGVVATLRVTMGSNRPARTTPPGHHGCNGAPRDAGAADAVRAVVVIVRVFVDPMAVVPPENWQLAPAGRPPQLNVTLPVYPERPSGDSVVLAALPAATLPVFGDSVNANCTGEAIFTCPLWLTRLIRPPAVLLRTSSPGLALL